MDLIAWINQHGNVFVGMAGRDDEWVQTDNAGGSQILNESNGEIVSIEDIERAYMEHKPHGTSMHFADYDVQDFFNQNK